MNIIKVSHLNYHTASLMSMTKAKLKGDLHTNEYYSIHATVVAYSYQVHLTVLLGIHVQCHYLHVHVLSTYNVQMYFHSEEP